MTIKEAIEVLKGKENNLEKGYIQKNWYRKKILFE